MAQSDTLKRMSLTQNHRESSEVSEEGSYMMRTVLNRLIWSKASNGTETFFWTPYYFSSVSEKEKKRKGKATYSGEVLPLSFLFFFFLSFLFQKNYEKERINRQKINKNISETLSNGQTLWKSVYLKSGRFLFGN